MKTTTLSKSQFLIYASYIFNKRLETIEELRSFLDILGENNQTDAPLMVQLYHQFVEYAKQDKESYEVVILHDSLIN